MRCTKKGLGEKGQRSLGHYENHLVPWRKEEEGKQNRGRLPSFRVVLACSWIRKEVCGHQPCCLGQHLSWPPAGYCLALGRFTALGIYSTPLPRLSWGTLPHRHRKTPSVRLLSPEVWVPRFSRWFSHLAEQQSQPDSILRLTWGLKTAPVIQIGPGRTRYSHIYT